MLTLREKMEQSSRFLLGTELVSVRGGMSERSAVKARTFANELVGCPAIDWISITDNAGGNPQLAPTALGKPISTAMRLRARPGSCTARGSTTSSP